MAASSQSSAPAIASQVPAASDGAAARREEASSRVKNKKSRTAMRYPFWFGGSSSSLAACVTHPLDLVKVRLQLRTPDAPRSMTGTVVQILRQDGPLGFYRGLSASLLRQTTYSTVRFGVYEELKTRLTTTTTTTTTAPDGRSRRQQQQHPPSFPVLIGLAGVSGFLGGVSGNAADVINVRMQHDAALPAGSRRNYRNAADGWLRMTREEGVRGWFRGWWPNSVRAAAMTASQLASYDAAKQVLIERGGMDRHGMSTHFTASVLAGVVAATVTSPVDVVKTRVMSAGGNGGGCCHHQGVGAVVADLYRTEGVRWLFRGWVPSFLRLGPQTICTFLFLETHRKIYRKARGVEDDHDDS